MFAVVTPEKIQLPPGAVVRLPGSWPDYRVQQLGDRQLAQLLLEKQLGMRLHKLYNHSSTALDVYFQRPVQ